MKRFIKVAAAVLLSSFCLSVILLVDFSPIVTKNAHQQVKNAENVSELISQLKNSLRNRYQSQQIDISYSQAESLLGFTQRVHQQKRQVSEKEYNQLSVRLELMADYLAGVWSHHNSEYLQEGDVEEALRAAHAIGDDTIQKRSRGYVVPDSFTHGTSEQRMASFRAGLEAGTVSEDILKGFFTERLD